jgi:hypothetical protein
VGTLVGTFSLALIASAAYRAAYQGPVVNGTNGNQQGTVTQANGPDLMLQNILFATEVGTQQNPELRFWDTKVSTRRYTHAYGANDCPAGFTIVANNADADNKVRVRELALNTDPAGFGSNRPNHVGQYATSTAGAVTTVLPEPEVFIDRFVRVSANGRETWRAVRKSRRASLRSTKAFQLQNQNLDIRSFSDTTVVFAAAQDLDTIDVCSRVVNNNNNEEEEVQCSLVCSEDETVCEESCTNVETSSESSSSSSEFSSSSDFSSSFSSSSDFSSSFSSSSEFSSSSSSEFSSSSM